MWPKRGKRSLKNVWNTWGMCHLHTTRFQFPLMKHFIIMTRNVSGWQGGKMKKVYEFNATSHQHNATCISTTPVRLCPTCSTTACHNLWWNWAEYCCQLFHIILTAPQDTALPRGDLVSQNLIQRRVPIMSWLPIGLRSVSGVIISTLALDDYRGELYGSAATLWFGRYHVEWHQ